MLESHLNEWLTINISGNKFKVPRRKLISKSVFFKNLLHKEGFGCELEITCTGINPKAFTFIVDWLKTSQLLLNEQNFIDLYDIADNLDIPEILNECKEFIQVLLLTSNPVFVYDQIQKSRNESLRRMGKETFAESFQKITKGRIYYKLDVKYVCSILSNDDIKVVSEKEVFEAGFRWLMYSWIKRQQHATKILNCVRFTQMDDEDLYECYEQPEYSCVTKIPECQKLIVKALLYKATMKTGKTPTFTPSSKPRNFPYQVFERMSLLHHCEMEPTKDVLHQKEEDSFSYCIQSSTSDRFHEEEGNTKERNCYESLNQKTEDGTENRRWKVEPCLSPLQFGNSPRTENKLQLPFQCRVTQKSIIDQCRNRSRDSEPNKQTINPLSPWSVARSPTSGDDASESMEDFSLLHSPNTSSSPKAQKKTAKSCAEDNLTPDPKKTNAHRNLFTSEAQNKSSHLHLEDKQFILPELEGIGCKRISSCPSIHFRNEISPRLLSEACFGKESANDKVASLQHSHLCNTAMQHNQPETSHNKTSNCDCNFGLKRNNIYRPSEEHQEFIDNSGTSLVVGKHFHKSLHKLSEDVRNNSDESRDDEDLQLQESRQDKDKISQETRSYQESSTKPTGTCLRKQRFPAKIRNEKANVTFNERVTMDRNGDISRLKDPDLEKNSYERKTWQSSEEQDRKKEKTRIKDIKKYISRDYGVSIMVVGGLNPLQHWASSDAGSRIFRYVIASQQWKEDRFLPEPRHHPAVACLDYQVYIIGGCNPHSTQNGSKISSLNSVLCYDIPSDHWLSKCHMISSRIHHAVLTRNGKIFAIGGVDERNRLLRSVEYYDPYTNKWTEMAPLCSPRMAMAAAIHDGEMWVCGGIGYNSDTTRQKVVLATVDTYNFTSNCWCRRTFPLRIARCFSTLVEYFGQLLLIGGAVNTRENNKDLYLKSISSIDVLNECQQRWFFEGNLLRQRHSCAAALLGRHLYLIGGVASEDSSALSSVERLDLMTLQSQRMPPMPLALAGMVAVAVSTIALLK